uniref:Mitogen-activated protein kinase n=1 Tax=Kalanchoe fedtschenkoi TaxID=63787 RepID=A0A7N0RBU1_KALFE
MAAAVQPQNGDGLRGKHFYTMSQTLFEIDIKYVLTKPVGRGAYGVVCSGLNRETNEKVAIKKIHKVFQNRIDALRTLRELQLLRLIRHENVIVLKDVMLPVNRSFKDVYLVYELMDTDLHHIIKSPQPLSADHCKYFILQLLRGLKYLHSANILHRDLKPGNLLINANCELKICDFGLARTSRSNGQFMTEYVVTRCQQDADIEFIDNPKARKYIKTLPYTRGVHLSRLYPQADPSAIDLLQKMLVFDPTKRISVTEALQHPYLAGLYDPNQNPPAQVPIDLELDENMEESTIREMIWQEMLHYQPHAISATP